MLLTNKTAVVYGGGGAIGSAVARAFASEGSRVFLAGRTLSDLESAADTIRAAGGKAEVATVDVLDRAAVEAHAAAVTASSGGIDIAFNATSNDDVQGAPLVKTSDEDVIRPVIKAVTAHLTIATAVAVFMKARRSGVILVMAGGREAIPALGGAHVAWSALAGLCRQLACELGPDGIRVAWLLSPGSPDAGNEAIDPEADATLLHRRPTLNDVARVATFVASDWASTMTATEVNITAGAVVD